MHIDIDIRYYYHKPMVLGMNHSIFIAENRDVQGIRDDKDASEEDFGSGLSSFRYVLTLRFGHHKPYVLEPTLSKWC
jgi:hypothetical protein